MRLRCSGEEGRALPDEAELNVKPAINTATRLTFLKVWTEETPVAGSVRDECFFVQ